MAYVACLSQHKDYPDRFIVAIFSFNRLMTSQTQAATWLLFLQVIRPLDPQFRFSARNFFCTSYSVVT